jgi:hypothetical protein
MTMSKSQINRKKAKSNREVPGLDLARRFVQMTVDRDN